ncbi:LANO_0D05468g1_1 [Lachancea nothofagi CBS 11611]|uniref:LANO_0D05468g1_1 n=1 Tax=Lachancea nothofagi CBS 11611 TaxID=1266666 RepID=A0A1G4JHL2_9SACH|nr:LANO_0D05468g1_1 [Lachancea nothofagi CBS 11611]
MVPKKRKTQEPEAVEEVVGPQRKYAAGKQPRLEEQLPHVDYHVPLDPESELFAQDDWFIPKFNLFISFTLDNLVESYKDMFKDFIKLPSRKFHPGYFYKIDQPISVNEIKSRDYEYLNGHRTFLLDVELIRKNCFSYNDPESLIAKNSMQVVNYVKYEVLKAKNVTRNYLINKEVKKFLTDLLNKVLNATDRSIAELMGKPAEGLDDTMHICEPFMELVLQDELPEYYEVIHRPSALKLVKSNLEMDYYTKIYDFYIDMEIVFENALVFNEPETLIYQDAEKLLRFFRKLMREKFFVDLKEYSERGEAKLEYDKIEYEQYLANGGDEETAEAEDDEPELEDYDFNHYEGLGNGYNRTLFSGDYLLGPNRSKSGELSTKRIILEPAEELPEESKYNLFKSLGSDADIKLEDSSPYTLIQELTVSSSRSYYKQESKPAQGALPSLTQKWVEYVLKGENMTQKENMYSLTLPPVQTSVTITTLVDYPTDSNYQSVLSVNKEKTSPSVSTDESPVQERYEVRLTEGNNYIEFTCQDLDSEKSEVLRLWIVVLP